jgi:hypothetical protein
MDTKILSCLRCGSTERMIPYASLADQSGIGEGRVDSHEIFWDANPTALLFKQRFRSAVFAHVCCDCGHVEMLVGRDKEGLWNAYEASKSSD